MSQNDFAVIFTRRRTVNITNIPVFDVQQSANELLGMREVSVMANWTSWIITTRALLKCEKSDEVKSINTVKWYHRLCSRSDIDSCVILTYVVQFWMGVFEYISISAYRFFLLFSFQNASSPNPKKIRNLWHFLRCAVGYELSESRSKNSYHLLECLFVNWRKLASEIFSRWNISAQVSKIEFSLPSP